MEELKVLYKDGDIAVIVKPFGVLSQKDAKGEMGVVEILSRQLGKTVYPVHRLDRPVGGVMVYAVSKRAAAELSRENAFEKVYLAVASGRPDAQSGEMEDYLYKDSAKGKSFVCSGERKGVKYARLEYTLVNTLEHEKHGELSLVRVKLHTGRTHQIRVQLSSRGMPLVGDGKYGSRVKSKSIALWSHSIRMTHPVTRKTLEFTSYPEDSEWFSIFSEIKNN